MAIGTAHVQRRSKTDSVSIITGGDAGTAEGDFASCLVWASRPKAELPMLITVQNNRWGISTHYDSQHGEKWIADRGKAFGIRTAVINGNDPVSTYLELQKLMEYVREERKPVLLEAQVSRLYGHSSASGANPEEADDCIRMFEKTLLKEGVLKKSDIEMIWEKHETESRQVQEAVRAEPVPSAESLDDHVFANGETSDWRKF
jgi:2-oxoisovalerate dehydrogenase E1 component alpha subunit